MARKTDGPSQLMMLGITPEAPRPARLDDTAMFDGEEIRMVHVDGETWWVLTDVARILGYRDAAKAMHLLRDKHKGTHLIGTLGGLQEMLTVSEPGLYRLMMRSNKPEAERFQDWISEEVLPAIRKYGFYSATPRLAKTMRRLNCDIATADRRHLMTEGYKAFCRVQAKHGAKPYHYARNMNNVYDVIYARDAKGMRVEVGAGRRAPLFDHMSRLALDIQRTVMSLIERCLEERYAAGEPVPLADQPAFIRARIEDAVAPLLAILGPGCAIGIIDDPRRGLLFDIVQKQIASPN